MAIEYTLYIDTESPPLDLQKIVCAGIGSEPDLDPSGRLVFYGAGLQGVVSVPDDVSRQFINEDFLFNARVRVSFRLDKFELAGAQDSLVRCISKLVRAEASDMLLLFNGELVVLRRRAGDLLLQESFGVWTPERLALFDTPYRVGSVSRA